VHLFDGMLTDARTGSVYWLQQFGKKGDYSIYPAACREGRADGRGQSFPLWIFERAILALLREVNPKELLAGVNGHGKLAELEKEMACLDLRIAELQVELLHGEVAPIAAVLRTVVAQRDALQPRLQQAQREAAHPLSAAWTECQGVLGVLDSTPGEALEATRCRLRAILRRIISEIWVLVVARGDHRMAAVQMLFHGGRSRHYLILSRRPRANRPAAWWARSLAEVTAAGDLDLRRREDATALAALLAETDLGELTSE
jgi:hypothetical protein